MIAPLADDAMGRGAIIRKPFTLRRVVDAAAVLLAAGLIASISWAVDSRMKSSQAVQKAAAETERFRQMIAIRAAGSKADLNPRGWPKTIDPTWFTEGPPRNELVSPERPWVEIATEEEADLNNPMIRMTVNPTLASFWYNPFKGILRARVPVTISDREALEWYNTINATNIDSIYTHDSLAGAPVKPKAEEGEAKPEAGEKPGEKPSTMSSADEGSKASGPDEVVGPVMPTPPKP